MSYEPKYFKRSDFECNCDGLCDHSDGVVDALLIALDKLRASINKPIIVNCGYRCKKHNKAVGGETNSYHMKGMAADIRCTGMTSKALAKAASSVSEFSGGGIGTYKNFVHVDCRGHRARWGG